MKVRKIDESHDWTFGHNQSDFVENSLAIKQSVLTAVLSVRGDWFLNLDHGVDWVNYLGRASNLNALENDLKRNVLAVNGVTRINDLNLDLQRESRKATIDLTYSDMYGNQESVSANVRN